ncbi:MAG: hypothetical protein WCK86_17985 [Planctomycetia bacterium]
MLKRKTNVHIIALLGIALIFMVTLSYVRTLSHKKATDSICLYFFAEDSQYSCPVAGVAAAPELTANEVNVIEKAIGHTTLGLSAIGQPVRGGSGSIRKIAVVISGPTIEFTVNLPEDNFVVVRDGVVLHPANEETKRNLATLVVRSRQLKSDYQTTYLYHPSGQAGVGGNAIDWEWVSKRPD